GRRDRNRDDGLPRSRVRAAQGRGQDVRHRGRDLGALRGHRPAREAQGDDGPDHADRTDAHPLVAGDRCGRDEADRRAHGGRALQLRLPHPRDHPRRLHLVEAGPAEARTGREGFPIRASRVSCRTGLPVDNLPSAATGDGMETMPGKAPTYGRAPQSPRRTPTGRVSEALLDRLASRIATQGIRDAFEVRIPFTGETLGLLPACAPEDVRHAVRTAREEQLRWARTRYEERAKILLRFHDLLLDRQEEAMDLIQLESGKARRHAFEEVIGTANTVRYYVNVAERILRPRKRQPPLPGISTTWQYHHPVGVVGFIAPWNFPLLLAVDDLVPCLLAGNGAVLKPDPQASFTALWALDLLLEAGLPFGLFSIVTGSGPELGPPLVQEVDYIAVTGSTETGRIVGRQAGERLIGASLELGGKRPMIVRADANLKRAVAGAIWGSFASAGQVCLATERIFVHRSIYEPFVQNFVEQVRSLRLGAGLDWGPDMGSLTSERQLRKVTELVDAAVAKGARPLCGGRRREDLGPYFYEPTVLEGITPEMRLFHEEAFGPVVWIEPFLTDEEAIEKANQGRYGLAASVYGEDAESARNLGTWIRAGTVTVNDAYPIGWAAVDGTMGGVKDSGPGRRHGEEGIRRFTYPQTVTVNRGPIVAPPRGEAGARRFAKVLTGLLRTWRRIPFLP